MGLSEDFRESQEARGCSPLSAVGLTQSQRHATKSGANKPIVEHYALPPVRPFLASERDRATLLVGGLSTRHDAMFVAIAQGLGYKAEVVPISTVQDFHTGREFCNRGFCNPTYFTTGALINHLRKLKVEKGLSSKQIVDNYIFLTAGGCGPCRFGMYEPEYRLALQNSGFDGFRVLAFQQEGGPGRPDGEAGISFDVTFVLALFNAGMIADVLNELFHHIKPYETEAGSTEKAFAKVDSIMQECLRSRDFNAPGGIAARIVSKPLVWLTRQEDVSKLVDQLFTGHFTSKLRECRKIIDNEIQVDYTRQKPMCKIVGEFWAQTTDGDGNYKMFRFLESQGAEILAESLTTWIQHLLALAYVDLKDKKVAGKVRNKTELLNYIRGRWTIRAATLILNREYDRVRNALGGTAHPQLCHLMLQEIAKPFYNRKATGGEAHVEVAKNIYYTRNNLAHMVLGLKPFGCLPSTQSDGAQAAVIARHPDMIYVPIETSGDGEINAYNKAMMALEEAKAKSKEEFNSCLARTGLTLQEIRDYCKEHPELTRPLQKIPRFEKVAGRAASFVSHVAGLIKSGKNGKSKGSRTVDV